MNLETQILAVMDDRKSSNIFLQEIKKGLGYFPAFVLSFPDKNIWHFPPKEFSLHLASTRSILHTHGWESDFESRKNYTFSERANFNLYLRGAFALRLSWKLLFSFISSALSYLWRKIN